MTRVTMARSETLDWYCLRCTGHATGNQQLCAAISCLVQSLEGWLEANPERAEVWQAERKSGYASFRFRAWDRRACRGVWELLEAGFTRLVRTDPEKISLKIEKHP